MKRKLYSTISTTALSFAIFAFILLFAAGYPFFRVADEFHAVMKSIAVTLMIIAFFAARAARGRHDDQALEPKIKFSDRSKLLFTLSAVAVLLAVLMVGAVKFNMHEVLLPSLSKNKFNLWMIFTGSILMVSAALMSIIAIVSANKESIARKNKQD